MNETVEQLEIQNLPLAETHRRHGATFEARGRFMLPATYGDARAEYEAVRGGASAGLIDLSTRGRIEVGGTEAVQFLNGLVTNDVKTLQAGAWMLAAFPNAQGRLLAHARVARPREEVSFLIDTEHVTHEKVFQTLQRFTLAGDFRVGDVTGETAQFSLQGARAGELVETVLGGEFIQEARPSPEQQSAAVVEWREGEKVSVLHATHTGEDGYDLFCAQDVAADLWEALTKAGARAVGHDAFEVLRVEAGVPRQGVDVTESNVVLEAGLEREAVSYTKGCYIGQEIIARIHWRGHVAKRLAGLVLEADADFGADAKVRSADGKEAGRITSHVYSPRLARRVALAILKYDYLQPGTEVSVVAGERELSARVSELPFVRGSWYDATGAPDEREATS